MATTAIMKVAKQAAQKLIHPPLPPKARRQIEWHAGLDSFKKIVAIAGKYG
jgi:hypothetical protein